MVVVGPGAVQQDGIAPSPLLEGASEYEFVTVLNPLTVDFAVQVAQDLPVNMPLSVRSGTTMTQSENDAIRNYGIGKNPDFVAKKHIMNSTIIESGKTKNFRGSEAQVAVRQIVNEMMQREGKNRFLADPTLRRQYEERIVIGRGNVQELMDNGLSSIQQQTTEALNKSNEVHDEPEFPSLTGRTEESQGTGETISDPRTDSSEPVKRSPGRPAKT